jgi:hypothetical protein
VNVCSSGTRIFQVLSPFAIGPVRFTDVDSDGREREFVALNFENFWQFGKVFPADVDAQGEPSAAWWALREHGWADPVPHRRPRGRGILPLYAYWHGTHLDYAAARVQIYIRKYVELIDNHPAVGALRAMIAAGDNVQILGYDGRDFTADGLTLAQCLADMTRPFGHELVITALLRGERPWDALTCA